MRSHPSFAKPQKLSPPNKRREAERRKAQCLGAAPHNPMLPPDYARARQRAKRSPLASRRSAAALAKADASTFGSAPDPRFLRPGANGRYPCSPVSSLPRTAGTGRSAGRSGTQSRPGAVCETARGHRTRPANRIASGMHPSRASWLHVTTSGTDVNRSVTPYFSPLPRRERATLARSQSRIAELVTIRGLQRTTDVLRYSPSYSECYYRLESPRQGSSVGK